MGAINALNQIVQEVPEAVKPEDKGAEAAVDEAEMRARVQNMVAEMNEELLDAVCSECLALQLKETKLKDKQQRFCNAVVQRENAPQIIRKLESLLKTLKVLEEAQDIGEFER